MDHAFVLKGDICYSTDARNLCTVENGYLVCENGISRGVFPVLPEFPLLVLVHQIAVPVGVEVQQHPAGPQQALRFDCCAARQAAATR